MNTWVVIYQTNLGYTYGWLCRGSSISEVEENFWLAMGEANGKAIKCIATLESDVLEACLSLYEHKED